MPNRSISSASAAFAGILCLLIVATACAQGQSQQTSPAGIEVVDVPLVAWVGSRQHANPETLQEFSTDPARAASFRIFVQSLAAGDWLRAIDLAKPLAYELIAIRDGEMWFVVASDDSKTGRDPTIVINLTPARDVILQAPHVPFETGTAEQATILLRNLAGRAAIVSGAHRCASKTFTSCDGKTEVCGSLQSYRESDAGHSVSSLFHVAHVEFAGLWNKSVVVSLHGMREDDAGVRTTVIISDGAHDKDVSQQTVATKLRLALSKAATHAGMIVSCNWPEDEKYGFRKLCGYTNVQGRHVNNSADVCRASVDNATGRFVHLEQDWSVLKPYAHNWPNIDKHEFSRGFIEAFAGVVPLVPRP